MISAEERKDKRQLLQLYGVDPEKNTPHAHSGYSNVSFFMNYVSELKGLTTDVVDILQTYGALDNLTKDEIKHIKHILDTEIKNRLAHDSLKQ